MRLEMRDQRRTPRIARLGIAQRVELQRHAVGNAQFVQQLIRQHEQFDIRRRFGSTDHFGVDLVELAEAALLRAFVTEHRAVRRDLQGRILLPPLGQIGACDAGGEFRAQRQRIAAAVLEGVHFLRDDIGRLAERAREHRGRLEHGQLDALEAIESADAVERVDDAGKAALVITEDVLRTTDAFGGFDTSHEAALSKRSLRRLPDTRFSRLPSLPGRGEEFLTRAAPHRSLTASRATTVPFNIRRIPGLIFRRYPCVP